MLGGTRPRTWGWAAALAALLALATPAQSAAPHGRLLFEAGDSQVVVTSLDDGALEPLTFFDDSQYGLRPGWSPDARRVVYITRACSDPACATRDIGQVVVVDVRTLRSRVVASLPGLFLDHATWSPDGRRIAFDVVTPGPLGQATVGRVMVVDTDGSDLQTVALGLAPSWAPDSRRLALTEWTSGSLVVVDVATGATTTASPDGVYTGPIGIVKNYAEQPSPASWSPDGRWLAFSGVTSATHAVVDDDPQDWHAWVVHPDGTGARRLHSSGRVIRAPSWSPDSRRLVYDDARGITVEAVDGRGARRIAENKVVGGLRVYVGFATWSPHGSLIAYERDQLRSSTFQFLQELLVVRPDGRGAKVVTRLESGAYAPLRWAPDSRS